MATFQCDKCGKKFDSKKALQQHKKDYDHSKLEEEGKSFTEKVPVPSFELQWPKKYKKTLWITTIVIVVGDISALVWSLDLIPSIPEEAVVSRNGLHRHARLEIEILGKNQTIPVNVGIGAAEKPIHTHTERNVVHLEFSGLVKKDDIRLSRFFKIWGKRFNKECIFNKCNGPEGQLKMFVNGEPNHEFGDYIMEDEDRIELVFG